jgi:hypothetical protein
MKKLYPGFQHTENFGASMRLRARRAAALLSNQAIC